MSYPLEQYFEIVVRLQKILRGIVSDELQVLEKMAGERVPCIFDPICTFGKDSLTKRAQMLVSPPRIMLLKLFLQVNICLSKRRLYFKVTCNAFAISLLDRVLELVQQSVKSWGQLSIQRGRHLSTHWTSCPRSCARDFGICRNGGGFAGGPSIRPRFGSRRVDYRARLVGRIRSVLHQRRFDSCGLDLVGVENVSRKGPSDSDGLRGMSSLLLSPLSLESMLKMQDKCCQPYALCLESRKVVFQLGERGIYVFGKSVCMENVV